MTLRLGVWLHDRGGRLWDTHLCRRSAEAMFLFGKPAVGGRSAILESASFQVILLRVSVCLHILARQLRDPIAAAENHFLKFVRE